MNANTNNNLSNMSNIMSLKEMQERLKDKKLYIVADKTGLSYPTLKKIADGKKGNYTYNTLIKLTKYLKS